MRRTAAMVLMVTLSAGCGGGRPEPSGAPEGCADVAAAVAVPDGDGTYRFDVTVRSADTGWDQYADLWQVIGPDGEVLGERVLAHPHVDEQPFTRSQGGIAIPDGVGAVTVRARDSVGGFCGAEILVEVAG